MSARTYQRFHPLQQLREEMDRLVSEFAGALPRAAGYGLPLVGGQPFPAVNVWASDDAIYAETELPGLRQSDLDISVLGNEVTITGQRPDIEQQGVKYHRRERGVGSFSRTIRLPVEIDPQRVEATLRDGVLTLKLPKAEANRPRKIKVTTGN